MTAEAQIRISASNQASQVLRAAERDMKRLVQQGELLNRVLRGGAIVAAYAAFTRLAEGAAKTAQQFGMANAALIDFNRTMNTATTSAKKLGAALAEEAFAELGFGGQRREITELTRQLDNLKRLQQSQQGFLFTDRDRADTIARIADVEQRLSRLRNNLPFGERTRAPGSRGGGTAAVLTNPTPDPKLPKFDPLSGLGDVQVYAREVFSFANAQSAAFEAFSASDNEDLRRNVQELSNETTRMLGSMTVEYERATSAWTAFAEQGARNIQDAFAQFLFDPFSEGLRGMARGFVDAIRQMLAQYLAFTAITGLGGALGNSTNPFLKSIGGFLSGARANGGPVTAGGAYLVGERGPELFVPQSSGTVMANGAGFTMQQTVNLDARGGDSDRIAAMMPTWARMIKESAIAGVQEKLQRGRLT